MPRIHLVLSDVQHKWLETHSDSLRTKSAIIRDLIDSEIKGLDATPRLSAYHVGAGEKVLKEVSEVQTSILPKKISPDGDLGESVGREREGTPRKPPFKKIVPDKLKIHEKAIFDYFAKKPGEHNKNAWNRLINGLMSIHEADGHVAVKKQLQRGTEEGWRSITFSNYQKYKDTPKALEPETKHPSYQVFTAKDGFGDDGKTTNELLGGLI